MELTDGEIRQKCPVKGHKASHWEIRKTGHISRSSFPAGIYKHSSKEV